MAALFAEIRLPEENVDARRAPRRQVRLVADARGINGDVLAVITNLSRTGMLIDTAVWLSVGEPIDIELPESGTVTAHVVWTRGRLAGCEFRETLTQAAVSAAQLLSPHTASTQNLAPLIDDDFDKHIGRATRDHSLIAIGALSILALAVFILLVGLIIVT